eukprot:TRINITY_DN24949_c0_g1_i2.p1 TRINITY_DN24949_c0_g1~~TRINITY_DN24949_c0_g1_i2.p1  ORF type:complete len:590 (-),score=74.24 TRINITY_DN24949_c0_g1_i2:46-1815(-)
MANGIPVALPSSESGSSRSGSFIVGNIALGPSPLDHEAYQHYINSPLVDVNREYRYPEQYASWLPGLAIFSAFTIALTYAVGPLIPPLLTLGGLLSGCAFGCVHCTFFFNKPPSSPQPLSRRELRHLVGRTACTFYSVILWLLGLVMNMIFPNDDRTRWLNTACYVFICLSTILILFPSWLLSRRITKEPVKAGLLMNMFWSGAIFSAGIAGIPNTILIAIWQQLDPDCNAMLPVGENWPWSAPSGTCVAKATLEWILTPGIVEESLKFVVLLRLVTSLEEAVNSRALTRCPRMSEIPGFVCCGWFLKLAPSPIAVVLCGMAVGGGFSAMENVGYINSAKPEVFATGDLMPAAARLFSAALHITMTGTCAFFLASWKFSDCRRWWLKYMGFLLMMIGHGCYDSLCTLGAAMPPDQCFTRVSCSSSLGCIFDRKGDLASCECEFGIGNTTGKPGSYKCKASNATLKEHTSTSRAATGRLKVLKSRQNRLLRTSLHTFLHSPLDGLTAVKTDLVVCPANEEDYSCGPLLVSWWPTGWTPFVLGSAMMLFFAVLGCCALPAMERNFEMHATARSVTSSIVSEVSMQGAGMAA